jgi:hypothetical protein
MPRKRSLTPADEEAIARAVEEAARRFESQHDPTKRRLVGVGLPVVAVALLLVVAWNFRFSQELSLDDLALESRARVELISSEGKQVMLSPMTVALDGLHLVKGAEDQAIEVVLPMSITTCAVISQWLNLDQTCPEDKVLNVNDEGITIGFDKPLEIRLSTATNVDRVVIITPEQDSCGKPARYCLAFEARRSGTREDTVDPKRTPQLPFLLRVEIPPAPGWNVQIERNPESILESLPLSGNLNDTITLRLKNRGSPSATLELLESNEFDIRAEMQADSVRLEGLTGDLVVRGDRIPVVRGDALDIGFRQPAPFTIQGSTLASARRSANRVERDEFETLLPRWYETWPLVAQITIGLFLGAYLPIFLAYFLRYLRN